MKRAYRRRLITYCWDRGASCRTSTTDPVATAPGTDLMMQRSTDPVATAPGTDVMMQRSIDPVATAPSTDLMMQRSTDPVATVPGRDLAAQYVDYKKEVSASLPSPLLV